MAQLRAGGWATLTVWTLRSALVACDAISESPSWRRVKLVSKPNAIGFGLNSNRPSVPASGRRHPSPRANPSRIPSPPPGPRGPLTASAGIDPFRRTIRSTNSSKSPLPDCCPHCGGDIAEDTEVDEQYQEEIPIKPIRRKIRIHKGKCRHCGRRVRGRHAKQTSDAVGAAASQIGPDAQATITYLNKHSGMSFGKIADLFERTYGIHLTRTRCAQAVLRAGRRLKPVYEEIKQHVRDAEHLTPDETGWKLGGHPVWLHAWVAGDGATCFAIDRRRGAQVLEETIGIDWSGAMTHDGYSSYDRFVDAVHQQCLAHPLRRAHTMAENATGRAKDFPCQVIDVFQGALAVRDQFLAGKLSHDELLDAHEDYNEQLRDLSFRPRVNDANERLAKHLYNHSGPGSCSWSIRASPPPTIVESKR